MRNHSGSWPNGIELQSLQSENAYESLSPFSSDLDIDCDQISIH